MTDEQDDESAAITNASQVQLWFAQFRDLSLIELALAGGITTLMGTVFQETPQRTGAFVGVVALGLGAIYSLLGQAHVVGLSDQGRPHGKRLRIPRGVVMVLLGARAGSFVMVAPRGLGLRT